MIGKLFKVLAGIGVGSIGLFGLGFSLIALISLTASAAFGDQGMFNTNLMYFLTGGVVGIAGLAGAAHLIFR